MSTLDFKKMQNTASAQQVTGNNKSLSDRILALMSKDFQLSPGSAINDKFKAEFYAELALLLSEGIDLKSAFTILSEQTEKPKIETQLSEIRKRIINGEKLADAVKINGSFSNYEFYSIMIGEESGKLIEVMKELSLYFERKVKLKRQLTSALIYPAIVLFVAIGTIAFMLNFVVPMFSEVFKRVKGDLPTITKFIIRASVLFKSVFGLFAIITILLSIAIYSQRKKTWFRDYTSRVVLKIPVLGELLRKIYLARFSQSLSLLLRSRVSIIKSLDLIKNMIDFYPVEITIEDIKASILKGDSLNSSLSRFPIYNKKMISMIRVAEDVNKLDEMLGKVSMQLAEETEHQIELFNKLLEPVLIVILGVIVGTILVSMYLPLFQLGSQIGA